MKIDCFMFLDGFDVLKLRLSELSDHIDQFVLVESPYNFHGDPKPLYFKENPITGYNVRHVVVEDIRHNRVDIHDELSQDNMIGIVQEGFREGTKDCDASDLLYLGDFDEIPRPSKLLEGPHDTTVGFVMDWYLYWLNCKVNMPIEGTCRVPFGLITDFWSAMQYRYAAIPNKIQIQNGGWHFSSFGGPRVIMHKLAGFPAANMRHLKYEDVERMILNAEDIHNGAMGERKMGLGQLDLASLLETIQRDPMSWMHLVHPAYAGYSTPGGTPASTAPRTE